MLFLSCIWQHVNWAGARLSCCHIVRDDSTIIRQCTSVVLSCYRIVTPDNMTIFRQHDRLSVVHLSYDNIVVLSHCHIVAPEI